MAPKLSANDEELIKYTGGTYVNRLFQGIIHQMKDAINRMIGVIDENGVVVSCSEPSRMGETRPGIRDDMSYGSDATQAAFTYRLVSSSTHSDYAVFVEGEDRAAEKDSLVLSIALGNMLNLYDEKYDKTPLLRMSCLTISFRATFISNQRSCILRLT